MRESYGMDNKPADNMQRLLANHIGYVCSTSLAKRYIDFGCWTGQLNANLKYYWDCPSFLIDAVESNCIAAQKRDLSATVRWLTINHTPKPVTVLYQAGPEHLMSLGASIYQKTDKEKQVKVPAGPNITPTDYANQYKEEFRAAFVKVNIEGADLQLVNAMLDTKIYPGALMFELPHNWDLLPVIIRKLHEAGFYIPDMLPLTPGRDTSYCFSRDLGFVKQMVTANKDKHVANFSTFRRP